MTNLFKHFPEPRENEDEHEYIRRTGHMFPTLAIFGNYYREGIPPYIQADQCVISAYVSGAGTGIKLLSDLGYLKPEAEELFKQLCNDIATFKTSQNNPAMN